MTVGGVSNCISYYVEGWRRISYENSQVDRNEEIACRSPYCKQGDSFVVKDLCPPLCHEFWNSIYPSVYALLNGALLDYGRTAGNAV